MKLEDQVCSLELAKRLKELGVKQDSLFYWAKNNTSEILVSNTTYTDVWDAQNNPKKMYYKNPGYGDDVHEDQVICSAFTVAELGLLLPNRMTTESKDNQIYVTYWYIGNGNMIGDTSRTEFADTEANARAKILVYLLENKLITL